MSETWLVGATVVDGLGGEPVRQAVLVRDGVVAGLGGEPPAGADVLDCAALVLTPGLIDAHVHLGLSSDMTDNMRRVLPVAEIAADMFATCAETLAGGFTTVRDVGGADGGLVGVVASGKVPGPRILTSGPILCQTGGHGYLGADWEPTEHWDHHAVPGLRTLSLMSDGPDEMRKNAREAFRRGASFLKLCVTGGVVSNHDELTDTQFTVDEIRAAVEEAAARGTYVTVHAHNNDGIRNAVEAGARCVEHGSQIDEETAALMARNGVALVPTLSVVEALYADPAAAGLPLSLLPRVTAVRQSMRDAIPVARAAGVRVGSGSDLIGPHQRDRGMELVLRASLETPMDALVAATSTNADILGIADEVGTIEVGKRADLVAWSADPLADATVFNDRDEVALVLQAGRIVRDSR